MKRYIKLLYCIVVALMVVVGCSDSGKDEVGNKDNATNSEEDKTTEKDLIKSLVETSNNHKNMLLKDGYFYLDIDEYGYYIQDSWIDEGERSIEITIRDSHSEQEFEGTAEEYELSNGIVGEIGDVGGGNISFVSVVEAIKTEIDLGDVGLEEGKRILDSLQFRETDITEETLKETIGVDYEAIKYYNSKGTDYDVTDIWFVNGEERYVAMRYYNKAAGEYDAVDVYVSKEDFERNEYEETKTVQTEEGKKVDIIDDGYLVEWFWEEEGYKYKISGNYNEQEQDKKDANVEFIDRMTKMYGE